ncbi:MAG: TraB/GumN family protein [Treponema sp.]|uniref:TraB/GumN family protein n=1 Tax=Treponema sp. TaxID=166 RepID=UPI003FA21182
MNQIVKQIPLKDRDIILVGTAHISRESIEDVERSIREEQPDCVCVELDEQRYKALTNEKQWQELDIIEVLKSGKGFLLLANLVLAAFQKRIGADVGVKPGDEMKAAITAAQSLAIHTELVDRPIHTTLKRAWAKNNLWGKSKLLATLLSSAFSTEKLSAEEIEALKDKSEMDGMMAEMAAYLPQVKEVLIDERDRYLATKIWNAPGKKIVAVLGAGHLEGTQAYLEKLENSTAASDLSDIAEVPPKTKLSKLANWFFPALIVVLVAAGFFKGGVTASTALLIRWILWNGSLAALGTLAALGHPLSIIAGFIGAPLATLNPFIGVGLFTGIVQAWVRKPQVSDMENLATDVTTIRGWYKNKIAHILLIFFLSSLGGAIGNFIAVPALIGGLL